MNCNTQNAKIKSITEKTLIVGIDVGSETHYARAFDWRNIEFSKKPFAFSNDEAGFASFKACASWYGTNRTLLVQSWSIPAGQRNEASTRESSPCTQVKGIG